MKTSNELWTIPGVELFTSGTHKGVSYSEAELRAVVSNFRKYRDRVRPTVCLGHEEQQPLADGMPASPISDNSGQPAFGSVEDLRIEDRDGTPTLIGDLANVPGWLAD